ncbi:fungal-specific transcription factor domain-containing protein [Ephemerocybe angulata]|uniref:Fungal-specific transcription factor domain-containing protein n=1 Tax=Ephemerocybe angulata TaxID=980116 RepID=A0A8H6MGA5_9AGAR|nr:fungal-specific transcription factor domain-containing protein [Tulosesus angulatus]
MSSEGESRPAGGGSAKVKRRRLHGACDLCRQKKTRCDSAKQPGNVCTNCTNAGAECTHHHMNQKIGQGYVSSRKGLSTPSESLSFSELRESMNGLLKTILSPTYQAPTNANTIRETLINLARYARALESVIPSDADMNTATTVPAAPPTASASSKIGGVLSMDPTPDPPTPPDIKKSLDPSSPDYDELNALAENLKRSVVLTSTKDMFLGAASTMSLLDTAIALGGDAAPPTGAIPSLRVAKHMRPEFWTIHPWDKGPQVPRTVVYEFPPPDLLQDLVDLYFDCVNVHTPLLHRPTFERELREGLHLSNLPFGASVLAVCAVASRYSNDKRVLMEGTSSLHSAGRKYYDQLDIFNEHALHAATIHEMQIVCLAIDYLAGTSTPEMSWFLVGLGLRAAVDVGMNRKQADHGPPTIQDELRKRIFWRLVLDDAMMSITVGRPPAINLIDYDLEPPVDCDDEYWENADPSKAFKQPPGKPSRISYYISMIKLAQIYLSARQAFYSVRHPEVPAGMTIDEWDREVLARLDSDLNSWIDSVPDHLRWGQHQPDPIFFDQSAILFTTYYFIQILVHRPFLSYPKKPSLSFTALAVCTNAARACSKILEMQSKTGYIPLPQVHLALFVSGLMLLLSIWRGKRTGFAMMDERKEAKAVQNTIRVLQTYEDRWPSAGRLRDLLVALTAVGGFEQKLTSDYDDDEPISVPVHAKTLKRRRDVADVGTVKYQAEKRPEPSSTGDESPAADGPSPGSTPPFEFPIYSNDLSTPFFQFHPSEATNGRNPLTTEQMDEIGAMMLAQETSYGAGVYGLGQVGLDQMFSGGGLSVSGGGDLDGNVDKGGNQSMETPSHMYGLQNSQNISGMGGLGSVWSMWANASSGGTECVYLSIEIPRKRANGRCRRWNDWGTYMTTLESIDNVQNLPVQGNEPHAGGFTNETQYSG